VNFLQQKRTQTRVRAQNHHQDRVTVTPNQRLLAHEKLKEKKLLMIQMKSCKNREHIQRMREDQSLEMPLFVPLKNSCITQEISMS